jgi:hypothetical protein
MQASELSVSVPNDFILNAGSSNLRSINRDEHHHGAKAKSLLQSAYARGLQEGERVNSTCYGVKLILSGAGEAIASNQARRVVDCGRALTQPRAFEY